MYYGNKIIITSQWLIYSESFGTVFCFPRELFQFESKLKTLFSKSGFHEWKCIDEFVGI